MPCAPEPSPELGPRVIADLQATFAAALLDADRNVPAEIVAQSEPCRLKRFSVYRNNVYASLVEVLRARFPAIARLVGEEFFRAMARVFAGRHPPRSRILLEYGEALPEFLETFEPVQDYPYLADVARLEWLRNVAYHAADAPSASLHELSAIEPARLPEARLVLHPSAFVVASPYPVVSIWAANTNDAEPRPFESGLPGEAALVVRKELEVLVLPLHAGAFAFTQELLKGLFFGEAVEAALCRDPRFDLSRTLAQLFSAAAVSGIETDPHKNPTNKLYEAEPAA
ncbi:DNA-binding domain-containing protein [Hyphomicrobium sp. CS1GBMeth3]|uniref:HvfC/BufC N-terminal domain-containing protein n=1 Tax=Hyphomicrobium sp. CS1GBMeth3 TaxID=1892845 RepID=UPI0009313C77|nr:DNA-binding domain-containing protein [Hyphomicrobium sp. CS1GBMeth3]